MISDANFVLNEVTGGLVAEHVYQNLRNEGVIIRYFGSQGGDLSNYIRISAGKPEDTDRVIDTLKDIGRKTFTLTPEATAAAKTAVIFDMDGVLADVTNSQHTVRTALPARHSLYRVLYFALCFVQIRHIY